MRVATRPRLPHGRSGGGTVSARLANSIERSSQLAKTYSPIAITQVQAADAARRRRRKRVRVRGGTSRTENLAPGEVSPRTEISTKRLK